MKLFKKKYPQFIKLYTDASKSVHSVDFAISLNNITLLHKLPPDTCIFSTESQAIYEAIILTKTITSNHILILSDSLNTLLVLQNFRPLNEITQNIQKILKSSTKKKIEFMRVPSHIRITGNKMVNKAANLATRLIPHPKISDLPTNDIKHKIYSRWQNYRDAIPPTNKLKTIKKNTKKWIPAYYLNRRQKVAITRCKIRHSFQTYSFLIRKNP